MRYFIFPLMFLICLSVASAQLYWYEPYLYNLDRVLNYRNFSGNFTASYFFGNGSFLSGIISPGNLEDNITMVREDIDNNFTRLTEDIENDTIIRSYNTSWIDYFTDNDTIIRVGNLTWLRTFQYQNETSRVDTIIDEYIPNNRTESEGVVRDNIDKNITDVRGNIDDNTTYLLDEDSDLNDSLLAEIKIVNTSLATELGSLNVSVLYDLGLLNTSLLTTIKEVNDTIATEVSALNTSVLLILRTNIDDNITDVRININDNFTRLTNDIENDTIIRSNNGTWVTDTVDNGTYVTLDRDETITGTKTFNEDIFVATKKAINGSSSLVIEGDVITLAQQGVLKSALQDSYVYFWDSIYQRAYFPNVSVCIGTAGVCNPLAGGGNLKVEGSVKIDNNLTVTGTIDGELGFGNLTAVPDYALNSDVTNNFTQITNDIENDTIIRDYNTSWLALELDNSSIVREGGDDYIYTIGKLAYFNDSKLSTIYYNVTQAGSVAGTISGAIVYTQHPDGNYDGLTVNITESAGSPGLDVRMNFTNVTDFNGGVMRYYTNTLAGDFPVIQLWNYDDSSWEDYPAVTESLSFATIEQAVFDSTAHIQNGVIEMRIYKAANGNTNNKYYVDWIAVFKGFGTPAGEEVDPHWTAEKGQYYNSSITDGYINNNVTKLENDIENYSIIRDYNTTWLDQELDNDSIIRDYNTTWIIQNDRDSNCSVDGSCELICYDSEIGVYYNQTDVAELGFFNDEINLTALLDDNYKDINDIYGNCSGSNCILGWGNLTGVADYANMSDLVQNCTSDGSCPLISYDSELGDYANITDLIHNCTDEGSCSLITYDSELGDYANISDLIQNETDRVDSIIDDYIPNNRTESEGVVRDDIDNNITDVRGNIDDNFTRLTNDIENDTIIRAGNISWITDNQDSGGGAQNNTYFVAESLNVTGTLNVTGVSNLNGGINGTATSLDLGCGNITGGTDGDFCVDDTGTGDADTIWPIDNDWVNNLSDVLTLNKTKVGLLNTSLLTEIKTVNTSLKTQLGLLNVSVLTDLGVLNTSLLTLIKEVNTTIATEDAALNASLLIEIGTVNTSLLTLIKEVNTSLATELGTLNDSVHSDISAVNTSLLTTIKEVNDSIVPGGGGGLWSKYGNVVKLNTSLTGDVVNVNITGNLTVGNITKLQMYDNGSDFIFAFNGSNYNILMNYSGKMSFTGDTNLPFGLLNISIKGWVYDNYQNKSLIGDYTNHTTVVEFGYHTDNENLSANSINTTKDFNVNKNVNVTAVDGSISMAGNVTGLECIIFSSGGKICS